MLLFGRFERGRWALDKVRFGKTGLMVSKIAFGGIPIQRLSASDAMAVVRGVLDMGINFIDTANGYSTSEERIGAAIKGIPRDSIVIATKSGARDKKTFLENLDLSLKRLGTDYIDIFQHHGIMTLEDYGKIMGEDGAFEGMTEAVRAGKVRFPAFSSHSVHAAIQVMREGRFAVVQLPFNFVDDEAAKEAIPLAKELDMGFISMKPLGGGLLNNAELAVKYLMQFDSIVPDPGIEKLSEMEEIVRIAESGKALTADDEAAIGRIKSEMGKSWCHRCDYCRPCPQGIAISGALNLMSFIKRMPFEGVKAMAGSNMENARKCIKCRECVGKCPYSLDIPELIVEKIAIWDKYLSENS